MVAPYDHVRVPADGAARSDSERPAGEATPAALAPGVYRVVGVDESRVTLLEVADASGERVHTGRVERVPRSTLDGIERVDSPDEGGTLAAVGDGAEGLALTLRYAPRRMAGRPFQTLVGLTLVVAEALGPAVFPGLPESVLTVAGVVGVLVLVAAALDRP
jgi:hypothetical protein